MPKVSTTIAVPTYNRARYLALAIESVLAQTNSNWELLIGDDGSSDETPHIVQRYLDDPRIRYRPSDTNLGYVATMQRLTGEIRTRYVTYLSDDDLLHPRWLEVFSATLDTHPNAVLAIPSARMIDAEGKLLFAPARRLRTDTLVLPGCEAFGNFVMGGSMTGPLGSRVRKLPSVFPGTLFRVDAVRHVGFEPAALMTVDTLLEAKLCLVGDAVYVDIPLVDFRNHEHISSRYASEATHLREFAAYMHSLFAFMHNLNLPDADTIEQYVTHSLAAHILQVSGATLRVAARYRGTYRQRVAKVWEYYHWAVERYPALRWRPETWLVMLASMCVPSRVFLGMRSLYWAIRRWQEPKGQEVTSQHVQSS